MMFYPTEEIQKIREAGGAPIEVAEKVVAVMKKALKTCEEGEKHGDAIMLVYASTAAKLREDIAKFEAGIQAARARAFAERHYAKIKVELRAAIDLVGGNLEIADFLQQNELGLAHEALLEKTQDQEVPGEFHQHMTAAANMMGIGAGK